MFLLYDFYFRVMLCFVRIYLFYVVFIVINIYVIDYCEKKMFFILYILFVDDKNK